MSTRGIDNNIAHNVVWVTSSSCHGCTAYILGYLLTELANSVQRFFPQRILLRCSRPSVSVKHRAGVCLSVCLALDTQILELVHQGQAALDAAS